MKLWQNVSGFPFWKQCATFFVRQILTAICSFSMVCNFLLSLNMTAGMGSVFALSGLRSVKLFNFFSLDLDFLSFSDPALRETWLKVWDSVSSFEDFFFPRRNQEGIFQVVSSPTCFEDFGCQFPFSFAVYSVLKGMRSQVQQTQIPSVTIEQCIRQTIPAISSDNPQSMLLAEMYLRDYVAFSASTTHIPLQPLCTLYQCVIFRAFGFVFSPLLPGIVASSPCIWMELSRKITISTAFRV